MKWLSHLLLMLIAGAILGAVIILALVSYFPSLTSILSIKFWIQINLAIPVIAIIIIIAIIIVYILFKRAYYG